MTPVVIVFSRDRACQLDALLRSIDANLDTGEPDRKPAVGVLWTATGDRYALAYMRCAAAHPAIHFRRERDFQGDLGLLMPPRGLVCFFTDDDIVHGHASLRDAARVLESESVVAFSFRLGENTTYCYPHDCEQALPLPLVRTGSRMRWQWVDAAYDFGYPLSLDGHVMRATDVWSAIGNGSARNPNELESRIALAAPLLLGCRPWFASYRQSVVTGIPANRVNETHPNRCNEDPAFSPSALNDRYLAGERINLDAIDFTGIRGAHQELELVLA